MSQNRRETDPVTPAFVNGSVKHPAGVYQHKTALLDDRPLREVAWPSPEQSEQEGESSYAAVLAATGNYDFLRPLSETERESNSWDRSLDDPKPKAEKKAKAGSAPANDNNEGE